MSNILILKHGSLGDIIQSLGTMKDIALHHGCKIDVLTIPTYTNLLTKAPWVNQVIEDPRKDKNKLRSIYNLYKKLKSTDYDIVYDLQNSNHTTIYRWLFFRDIPFISSRSIIRDQELKSTFDKKSVLDRLAHQLSCAGVNIQHCYQSPVQALMDKRFKTHLAYKPYIFLAPFCSTKNPQKKWPHFAALLKKIKADFPDIPCLIAPGPGEILEANTLPAINILDNEKPTTFTQLISIINNASFVITNDTGPAHIAAHAQCPGIVIMGCKCSAQKIGLLTERFRAIEFDGELDKLSPNEVYTQIKPLLIAAIERAVTT